MAEKTFLDRLRAASEPIAIHFIALLLSIVGIKIIGWVVLQLFGAEAKFLDVIPVKYVIDAIELLLLVKFSVNAWKDFKDA